MQKLLNLMAINCAEGVLQVGVPRVMRPSGPVPVTEAKWMLFSLAKCLVAGEAKTLYPGGDFCLTLATGASSISDGAGTVCRLSNVHEQYTDCNTQ